jgi:hypothetical protein
MKAFMLMAILVAPTELPENEHVPNHAVMFEFDYDATGDIGHAQAIGGYPTLERCQAAMPTVMGAVVEKLGPALTPQLLCSGIHKRVVVGTLHENRT